MRRILTLLLFFTACGLTVQSQSWLLYDGSLLPTETDGAELDLTSLSQDSPGPNMEEMIMDDPDIEGNKIFRYVQPDEDGTRMYRWYFEDAGGEDWGGNDLTIVARMRGLDDWETLGLDRIFDIQYRVGNNEARDELWVQYADSTVRFFRSDDAEVQVDIDLTEWHIYRITFSDKTSTLYLDENPVPVLTGESTSSTSDLYLKIGDGSSNKVGGLVDWFAVDTTGAYSPLEAPLDERFTGAPDVFDATNFKIAFITSGTDDEGELDEITLIQDLRNRGFQVDYTYNDPGDVIVPVDFEFSFEALADYDLVILGRSVSSGDFTEAEEWAAVETPILIFSGYLVRSSRMKLINSGSLVREVSDGTTVDPMRVTNVKAEDTPLYTGIQPDMDNEVPYLTWFYEYIAYGADTFEMNHNATLHATLAADGGPGDGNVYAASWEGGVEPYPGADVTLAGPRIYMQVGSDDQSEPKLKNFFWFTEESTLMLHNAIKILLGFEPDGNLIPILGQEVRGKVAFITKDVDDNGNLEEIEVISELRKRGYQVDVSYPDPGDIIVEPDFEFSFEALADYDVVIIGRGVSSGDFQNDPAPANWAAVETPVIVFSAYLMRNTRLNLANTGTARRENDDGNAVDKDRVTNVSIVDHPVFTGLNEDMDNEIPYLTWFYDYLGYGADTFEMNHNATLLATLLDEGGPGDGTVYMAYWDGGVETFPGSGTTVAGPRMYMQMGSDDSNSPKLRNYTAFTYESWVVLFNALDWLSGREPTGELPEAGPVAYWNMDEGDNVEVVDVVANANGEVRNGNGMTWESCGVGNSLNFAGATKLDAVVWVEDHPNLNFDGDQSFSISLLARIDPYTNTDEMNLILKGDNRNDGSHLPEGMGRWYAMATKDGELRLAVDDDVTKTQLGVPIDESIFPANEWVHIVGVRDRQKDSLYLYVNGVVVGDTLDETEGDISTPGLPTVIGNYHSGVRIVNGALDEIAVYDFALSADEVASLFASVSPTTDCDVVATIIETSNDASLASLTVSAGELDPPFDPEVLTYKVTLPEGSTSVEITAVANDPAATVAGDGTFTDLPGAATIVVTAEDGTTREYVINFSVEGIGPKRIVVPGDDFGTIETAIDEANDGDTLVLINGQFYWALESYQISKKIVMIAETVPALPGLENMPIIENLFTVDPLFTLNSGGDLHLIGIDVDGQGVANIFNAQGAIGESKTFAIYVNRCRLHNTSSNIFEEARDGNTDNTQMTSCIFRNSFIYDSGTGHALYVRDYAGAQDDYIFENITYWNVGQQFNWIRHHPEGVTQTFIYDHLTGYNLSTSTADDKELFGNADGPAALNIELKNSIFHTQIAENAEWGGSLVFNNTSGIHDINVNNNVLYEVNPIVDVGGTINKSGNLVDVDPMYADPDNGDFTVMNTDLYTAATDGEIIGALYWHPDFVDDFSDLTTSAIDLLREKFGLHVYPNPFSDQLNIDFTLVKAGAVTLNIFDLSGNLVKTLERDFSAPGDYTVSLNTTALQNGMYFYQLRSGDALIASKMIKTH